MRNHLTTESSHPELDNFWQQQHLNSRFSILWYFSM